MPIINSKQKTQKHNFNTQVKSSQINIRKQVQNKNDFHNKFSIKIKTDFEKRKKRCTMAKKTHHDTVKGHSRESQPAGDKVGVIQR